MSKISNTPVKDGEVGTAADLNTRFDNYTVTDLNAANTRNAAYDLPQFDKTSFYALNGQKDDLGLVDFFHSSPVTVNGIGTLPDAGYIVGDGANPTVAAYPAGIDIAANDIFRIYWNLSVHPAFTGNPWVDPSSISHYEFNKSAGGQIKIATNAACWVFYLEWDITDATLTNWTTVPEQGDFTTAIGATGYTGEALATCMATSVVPCWITWATAQASRLVHQPENIVDVGWRGISGCHYVDFTTAGGAVTVYGLRIRIKGPMHSFNDAGVNYLVHDLALMDQTPTNVTLEYTSGRINVLHHRLG